MSMLVHLISEEAPDGSVYPNRYMQGLRIVVLSCGQKTVSFTNSIQGYFVSAASAVFPDVIKQFPTIMNK